MIEGSVHGRPSGETVVRVVRKRKRSAARPVGPRPRPAFMRTAGYRAFLAVGFCLALGAIAHVTIGFVQDQPYFKVSQLRIEGVSKPIAEQLQQQIEGFLTRNRNMLSLNSGELAHMLEALPRVRNLRLEKVYPDTLLVRAAERQPAAVVVGDGFFLVDREGHVIEKIQPCELRSYDFPYISGFAPEEIQVGEKIYNANLYRALDLTRVLQERNPDLFARFSEIHIARDPDSHLDNMTAHLKGGMEVRFGDSNPIEKLPAFETFIKTQTDRGADPFSMAFVDLRFKDQVVFMDHLTALLSATGRLDKLREEEQAEALKTAKLAGKKGDSGKAQQTQTDAKDTREKPARHADAQVDSAYDQPGTANAGGGDVGGIEGVEPPQPQTDETVQVEAPRQAPARRGFAFWRRASDSGANDSTIDPGTR